VLFLVAWHVATYLSVQIAEVSPAFFEWMGWPRAKRFMRRITLGLTIAGIILSTLHQGALGALFNYAPGKLHPLWYSGFLWFHFLCSSIAAGLSMLIIVSTLCRRFLRWRCGSGFLQNLDDLTIGLGKGASLALITYIVIKLVAVADDHEWAYLLTGWGHYFLFELAVGAVLPLVIFTIGVRNRAPGLVRWGGIITVLGVLLNRVDTALIAFNWKLYGEIPHWKEALITVTIFAIYVMVYRFILYRWPILYAWKRARCRAPDSPLGSG
jgi:Ni/Fe-hydrogenase subunit HybB-like protein